MQRSQIVNDESIVPDVPETVKQDKLLTKIISDMNLKHFLPKRKKFNHVYEWTRKKSNLEFEKPAETPGFVPHFVLK